MNACDLVLYTDMDGTALTDWSLGPVVPERSLRLIRQFTRAGGRFSVASGRQGPDIARFFPDVDFGAPLVCGNGAVVYDNAAGRVLRRIDLPLAYKKQCADYFLAHRRVWIVAADEQKIYQVASGDPVKDGELTDWPRGLISLDEFLSRPFVKVVYITADAEHMPALKADVAGLPAAPMVVGAQSGPRYYEMTERTVSKADGIRRALALAGLEDRTLVCLGDYFNDLAMLQAADLAACPANAADGIKEICSIQTCSNNEGAVGDLIQRLLEL